MPWPEADRSCTEIAMPGVAKRGVSTNAAGSAASCGEKWRSSFKPAAVVTRSPPPFASPVAAFHLPPVG